MIILGYAKGLGNGLGDVATVQALQKTLQALGKNVYTAGQVDGYTLAALYEIVRDNLPRLPGMPGEVGDAVRVLKDLDSTIQGVTFGRMSTGSLLINSDTVIKGLRLIPSVGDSAANGAQKAYDAFKSAVANNALAINTALTVLLVPLTPAAPPPAPVKPKPFHLDFSKLLAVSPGATVDPGTATGTTVAVPAGGTIYAFDPSLSLYRVAKPVGLSGFGAAATFVEVGTVPEPPANATKVELHEYLVAVGKLPWYQTTWGMGLLAAGGLTALVGAILMLKRSSAKKGG